MHRFDPGPRRPTIRRVAAPLLLPSALLLLVAASPLSAADPRLVRSSDDLGDCAAVSSPAPSGSAPSLLEAFVDLDQVVRQGCPPKPLARTWLRARKLLAPFDREPEPDWIDRAGQSAARLPIVRPALPSPAGDRCPPGRGPSDWTSLGPTNTSGRVNSLAIDPRDERVVYAAAASGGVWKTIDGGDTWRVMTDGLPSIAAGAILLDPTSPDTIWFGTGEGPPPVSGFVPGTGVFKSTDGGESWARAGEPFCRSFLRLAYLPSTPPAIVAATDAGLFRSTDGGAGWEQVLGGTATDVVAVPGTATEAWAALGRPTGRDENGLYHSTDAGKSWVRAAGGSPQGRDCGRITLAFSPADPRVGWAGVQDASATRWLGLRGLWKTTDGGASWAKLPKAPDYCSYPPPYDAYRQCYYNNALVAHPVRPDTLLAGGIQIWRTGDGGNTFISLTDYGANSLVHVDQHAFAVAPSGAIWVSNDGGVFRTTDDGRTWQNRAEGLVTTQFYGLAQSPDRADLLLGGLQDNGSQRRQGDPPEWKRVLAGDGGPSAIDPTDPKVMYGQSWSLDVFKSTNGGQSFASATHGIPVPERTSVRTQFIAPLVMDEAHPTTLMAATWRVWRTTDGAANWVAISPDLAPSEYDGVSAIAFSPAGDGALWAGTSNGRIWVDRSGAPGDWTELTKAPLPVGHFIEWIAVDPSDGRRVWLGYGTADASNLFRTKDGGATWEDLSAPLPAAPVGVILVDPDDGRRVWLGTEVGVFFSGDDGATWGRWGVGFPAARTDDLRLDRGRRKLRVATHGRGVWEVSAGGGAPECPGEGRER